MKRYINTEYLVVNDEGKVLDIVPTEEAATEAAVAWMRFYVEAGKPYREVSVFGCTDADGRSYRLVFSEEDA